MLNTIESLEVQIKQEQELLKKKKQLLGALKASEKSKMLFCETKVGKFYFKALKGLTAPMANLNHNAEVSLKHPKLVRHNVLMKQVDKWLDKTLLPSSQKQKTRFALKGASIVMEVEDFIEEHEIFASEYTDKLSLMRSRIENLRPVKDEIKTNAIKDALEQGIQAFKQEHAKALQGDTTNA